MNRTSLGLRYLSLLALAVVIAPGACRSSHRGADRRPATKSTAAKPKATASAGSAAASRPAAKPKTKAACEAGSVAKPGLSEVSLRSGDKQRRLLLYVPKSYAGQSPLPLVLDLHGSRIGPKMEATISGIYAQADRAGFAVGMLAAVDKSWNVPTDSARADDVAYVRDAIAKISQLICVDGKRVYAMGYSGGGRMSSLLACRLSTQLAAVAPVAGLRFDSSCAKSRPLPVLTFHGTADKVNSYDGSKRAAWKRSIPDVLQAWAHHNGCAGKPTETKVSKQVTRVSYAGCKAPVVLYRVAGGGHTWPGSKAKHPPFLGLKTEEIDATSIIWDFFRQHQLASVDQPH